MARNVGGIDRAARVLVAFVLFGLAFFHVLTGGFAIVAYIVGAIALLTAVFAFCPAWVPLRINTAGSKHLQG